MIFEITNDTCEFILSHEGLYYEVDRENRTWKAFEDKATGRLTFSELVHFLYTNTHLPIKVDYDN